jgi:putative component of membrane protein insertase Oxa1/YidC/SpoIIIJ protein YidD
MTDSTHLPEFRTGVGSRIALGLIAGYQRWISPYKGFRCAHSVLHGGPGCSGYAKRAIREHGLWRAVGMVRQRFRDCRAAMHTLMTEQSEPPETGISEQDLETARRQREKRENRKEGWCSRNDCALATCEAPGACCGSGASAKAGGAAGGAGACAGMGEGLGMGTCGAAGESIAGACGVAGGAFSCCG